MSYINKYHNSIKINTAIQNFKNENNSSENILNHALLTKNVAANIASRTKIDSQNLIEKNYIFRIMPEQLKETVENAEEMTDSKSTTLENNVGRSIQRFEKSFADHLESFFFLFLQCETAKKQLIFDFVLEHGEYIEYIEEEMTKDVMAKLSIDLTDDDSDEMGERLEKKIEALQQKFPDYSLEELSTIWLVITNLISINYMKQTIGTPMGDHLYSRKSQDLFLQHKAEVDKLHRTFRKILIFIFPSLRQLHFLVTKKQRKRARSPNPYDLFFINIKESFMLNQFLDNLPKSWNKVEKDIDNARLAVFEMAEFYAEYLTLLHFYVEVSEIMPLALTINFNQTPYLSGLLDAITAINSVRADSLKLAITEETEKLDKKAKERVIKLPNDYHAITAFSMPLLARDFGYEIPNGREFHVLETEKDAKFQEVLIASQLTGLYFSQILSILEEPFIEKAIHETISFQKIEQFLSPESDYYEFNNIRKIADYFARQSDKVIIEKILSASAARAFVGIDVLLKQNKRLEEKLVNERANAEKLNIELESQIKNNVEFNLLEEEVNLLNARIESTKKERDHFQRLYHESSRYVAAFDELKEKYDEVDAKRIAYKQEQSELALENERMNELLKSYMNPDDIVDSLSDDFTDEAYLHTYLPFLLNQRIAIIGGHENWRARIKQLLPQARIFIPEHVNVSLDMISRADLVILNTATMNHSMFARVKEVFRKNDNGKFVYINTQSSNLVRTLEIINEQL